MLFCLRRLANPSHQQFFLSVYQYFLNRRQFDLALLRLYLFALLSLGLVISSRSKTQMEAIQRAQMFLLPSIMLSGYIFPLSSLPGPLRVLARILPATHYIAISRGIIIRGAGFADLWPSLAALVLISAVLIGMSARAFHKTIS